MQALREGGNAPVLLNAANEVAVAAFLVGSLPFLSIADLIEQVLTELPAQPVVDIQTLSERDRAARVQPGGYFAALADKLCASFETYLIDESLFRLSVLVGSHARRAGNFSRIRTLLGRATLRREGFALLHRLRQRDLEAHRP
jgi:hypothetical protein